MGVPAVVSRVSPLASAMPKSTRHHGTDDGMVHQRPQYRTQGGSGRHRQSRRIHLDRDGRRVGSERLRHARSASGRERGGHVCGAAHRVDDGSGLIARRFLQNRDPSIRGRRCESGEVHRMYFSSRSSAPLQYDSVLRGTTEMRTRRPRSLPARAASGRRPGGVVRPRAQRGRNRQGIRGSMRVTPTGEAASTDGSRRAPSASPTTRSTNAWGRNVPASTRRNMSG